MHKLIFFFLSFTITLFSAIDISPHELASLQGENSALIAGCVNAITGDFVFTQEDGLIKGAEPIPITRHYISREMQAPHLNWRLIYHGTVTLEFTNFHAYAQVPESNGVSLTYKSREEIPESIPEPLFLYPMENAFDKGIVQKSNTSALNNTLECTRKFVTVHQPNGGRRVYKLQNEEINTFSGLVYSYLLSEEVLPNGNHIIYKWKKHKKSPRTLSLIQTTNPDKTKVYAQIHVTAENNTITLKGSDGQTLAYTYRESKVPKGYPQSKANMAFLRRAEASHHPHEKLERSSRLLVEKRRFPDGREIELKYDKKDRVTQIIYPEGINTKIEYYSNYTVAVHPDQSKTYYFYDSTTLRLERVERAQHLHPDRIETFEWLDEGFLKKREVLDENKELQLTHTYEYDKDFRLIEKAKASKDGSYTTRYRYDHLSRLIEEKEDNGLIAAYTYFKNTSLPSSKMLYRNKAFLTETQYTYNEDHLLIEETLTDGVETRITRYAYRKNPPYLGMLESTEQHANGHLLGKTYFSYDEWGNISKKTLFDGDGKASHTLSTVYNKKGKLLSETDPHGQTIYYQYDKNGNVIEETTPLGLTIRSTYDKCNRLKLEDKEFEGEVLQTSYSYGYTNRPQTLIDPLGSCQAFQYDLFENVKATSHPCRGNINYSYNALGYITEEIHHSDRPLTTTYLRNTYGSPLQITHPDHTIETFSYNPDGAKTSYTNQNGIKTLYYYDYFGNISSEKIIAPSGELLGELTRTYSAFHLLKETDLEGRITSYAYDEKGRLKAKTFEGQTTTYGYDHLNRCNSEQIEDYLILKTFDLLDREIERKEYSHDLLLTHKKTQYDAEGNPTKLITYPHNQEAITSHNYDPLGRLIKTILPEGEIYTTTYSVNPLRNTLTTTTHEPEGIVSIEETDASSQLIRFEKVSPSGQSLQKITYTYDCAGNCVRETSDSYTLDRTFTERNELQSITENSQKTTHYTYTPVGQINTITKPDGTLLSHSYDDLGLLASDALYSYSRNKLGDLLASTTTRRTLDLRGNILEETLGNGYVLSSTYDSLDRRTSLTLPNGQTIFYTYLGPYLHTVATNDLIHTYVYDLAGNVIEETRPDGTSASYTLDKNSRLTSLSSCHFNQTLTYSHRSNITEVITNQTPSAYTFDLLDHLASEPAHSYTYDSLHNRISKDATPYALDSLNQLTDCNYDQNGNLIQKGTTHYVYDAFNRLINVITPQGTTHYTYDSEHRRLAKNNTLFIWDEDHELGTSTTYRILGRTPVAEIGAAIVLYIDNQPHTPIHDLLGNLVQTGPHTQHFTAFGEGEAHLPWGYSSKRHDSESNLIYFGRRYYDPELGRFLTPDPEGYVDSLNLYAFTLNNPLSNCDPFGLITTDYSGWFKDKPEYFQPVNFNFDFLASPRFQGSMQALGGLGEAGIGAAMTLGSGGIAAPLGWPVMMHGLDHFSSGMQSVWSNEHKISATQQLLERAGMPSQAASLVDGGLSIAGSMGGIAVIRARQLTAFPNFRLPPLMLQNEQNLATLSNSTSSKCWTNSINPFKGKTFQEIDQMLRAKGFTAKGPNPLHGKGSYFSPTTNRKYYLDHAGKTYRGGITELPHVDVHYNIQINGIEKLRFPIGEYLYGFE